MLFLARHGLAGAEQSLTRDGREEVARVARWAGQQSRRPGRIEHSRTERTRETALIFARELELSDVAESDLIGPDGDAAEIAAGVVDAEECLLVSHQPTLNALVSQLLSGGRAKVLDFAPAALAALDRHNGMWRLVWYVTPDALE